MQVNVSLAGGNAFNQIAVLAGLEGQLLAAVACYCRALLCKDAFVMARDNLLLVGSPR